MAKGINIDLEEIETALSEDRGFPLNTFFDPDIYEFELEAIFHRKWQYFAPLDKLKEPGSVVSGTVGKVPIVVTRSHDGKLYGMVNVCRHRGFSVVEGEKKCRLLTCRYHGWSYDLNGSLVSAPFTQGEESFDKKSFSLVPVRVDTWAQGVFVNPDAQAPSLREALPALDGWTEEKGFILDQNEYRFYRQLVIDQNSNWKLWYDNETECYHCATIHDSTFNQVFNTFDGDAVVHEVRGGMLSLHFPGLEESEVESECELSTETYRSFQFFPGCQLTQHDDLMLMGRMTPTGPQSCRWTVDYLIQKDADPDRVDKWIDVWHKTFREDADVTTIQQSNLTNGYARPFRFVPNRERMSQSIHHLIFEAYREGFEILGANSDSTIRENA